MKIKVLGAHNAESADARLVSLLIDDVLAVDAGSLTSNLSLDEQARVRSILLTHGHYDHVRDVPAIALNCAYSRSTINVYATPSTLEVLSSHLLNGVVYPRFTESPSPHRPALRFCPLEPHQPQSVDGYTVLALPVCHAMPTVGYQITSSGGESVFFSGDSGPGLSSCWEHISADLLILDVTLPDRLEQYAPPAGHLTPRLLKEELAKFKGVKGYLPPVLLVHLSPQLEVEIGEDVRRAAAELGSTITLGREGMRVTV